MFCSRKIYLLKKYNSWKSLITNATVRTILHEENIPLTIDFQFASIKQAGLNNYKLTKAMKIL